MKKLIVTLFVSSLILAGCGHGEYYKALRPEIQEMAADAYEVLQLHLDGKMSDEESERKLRLMYEELDDIDDLNTYEDSVKMYIQFASYDVDMGETSIDQMHNLEDCL